MTSTTWYRGAYWQMKGNREYTRSGYEAAATRFVAGDLDEDLTGRHVMITGANKGLGQEAAEQLARLGAVLHLVCRNMDHARDVRASVVSKTGNDKIHLYHLDLSRPRDVIRFCDDFLRTHDRLHVLINNAGVMENERVLDEDGLEYNFAVNTLAVHLMVTALVPLLQKCEDSRVITVSSGGMLNVRLDPEDLSFQNMDPFIGRLAYSQTKRQQVSLTLSYAQFYDKIHFSSMHPGWVDTLSVRTSIPEFYEANKDKLRTPSQGADTIVWLAASKRAVTHSSGLFFQDRAPVPTHLPLAWTRSTVVEEKRLLERLFEISACLRQPKAESSAASEVKDEQKPEVEPSTVEQAGGEIQDAKAASLPTNESEKEPNSIEDRVSELGASDAGPPNAVTSQTESQNNAHVSADSPEHFANESVKTEERIEAPEKKSTAEPALESLNSSLQAAVIDEPSSEPTAP